ncbi:hypothetical protein [Streptomyces sp. NPDC052292]|uniref:hypothetical protein n=1 Tax=Streptomyces sp. NPDC052292 TaxID=3155053 RepID=UPI003416ED95
MRDLVTAEVPAIPRGRPFPLERFVDAVSLAEAPAHGTKPLFVLDDRYEEHHR